MQLSVTGHHLDITAALRSYVESKIEKLERHFDLVSPI
jgi:putative sigma-54 modulation protein